MLPTLAGTQTLGPRTLGMFAMLTPFLMEQRNNPVGLQLEGFRMAEGGRMERRRVALALALVPPLTIVCYFWASLMVCYKVGLGARSATIPTSPPPMGLSRPWTMECAILPARMSGGRVRWGSGSW